ncbi:MAG: aldehyde dehydrogenase family protein [Ancalomicrobiaceae bacterium]|nr:aldehyde dehydrogenase family protein [Ancalomicrobiaceae bacterium]
MYRTHQFYIDGQWVAPLGSQTVEVIDPTTEEAVATLALGSAADVDRAVAAARAAFPTFAATAKAERVALLRRVSAALSQRIDDLAAAMTTDMGAPTAFARGSQAQSGIDHLAVMADVLEAFEFDRLEGDSLVTREPIGVVGMITPWNWPVNQIACKVAPALAAGCTMVLKPSEIAPLSALVFAECLDQAGVPAGVFNLVNGDGPTVGAAIAAHRDIDMVSFTGSTRAGIAVAKAAADTVKRVAQELGGNSPNVVLDDADLEKAVSEGVLSVMSNSGQSCDSPARMLVPLTHMREAAAIAKRVAEGLRVGPPAEPGIDLGPLVSQAQFDKVQRLIAAAIEAGATLVTGGIGRPAGLNRGYFVRPTVFADVTEEMPTFRNEVFGPVISLIGYRDEEDAVRLANLTEYGLAGRVQSGSLDRARRVARRLRAGWIEINGPAFDYRAPFGGYKQSGNGREYGEYGLHDYLEIKGVLGWGRG